MYRSQLSEAKKNEVRSCDRVRKAIARKQENVEVSQKKEEVEEEAMPTKYLVKKKTTQVLEILGENSILYAEVVGNLMKRCMRSPSKRKHLIHKVPNLVSGMVCKTRKPVVPTALSALKNIKKLGMLRASRKHTKASQLKSELIREYKSVRNLASLAGDDERQVYRHWQTPKKRTKA